MNGFILRTLITMLGLFLASALVPGVSVTGVGTFILAAVLLGLVNGFVRPLAVLMTLPLTLVTLGLFLFVVNAAKFILPKPKSIQFKQQLELLIFRLKK